VVDMLHKEVQRSMENQWQMARLETKRCALLRVCMVPWLACGEEHKLRGMLRCASYRYRTHMLQRAFCTAHCVSRIYCVAVPLYYEVWLTSP
jgi:hypothetical protein